MEVKTYLTLPSGQKLPLPGLGTFDARTEEEVERSLSTAFEKGYRHIDTALIYENEIQIGKVLKKWLSSGKLKREDLFITTKLPMFGVHPDRVERFIKKSLENLQLDYVDLYLIHFPVCAKYTNNGYGFEGILMDEKGAVVFEPKTDYAALWKKMEEQVDAGRAKNIGLSNFNIPQIQTILKTARIKPANLQVELHVYLQQRELVDFCQKNGITVVAYSPLGVPSYNDLLTRLGKKPKKLPDVLGAPVLGKLAQKYSKTPAQIALRFLIQRGIVPIPKSVTPKRVEENITLFDFNLTDDEMKELYKLDRGENGRISDWRLFGGIDKHPEFPFGVDSGDACRR